MVATERRTGRCENDASNRLCLIDFVKDILSSLQGWLNNFLHPIFGLLRQDEWRGNVVDSITVMHSLFEGALDKQVCLK